MADFNVTFQPQNRSVQIREGATLLEAASRIDITLNNLCGGDGICGRCKMIVRSGKVSSDVSAKLTREEIRDGFVLACQTKVRGDLLVEIPKGTMAREKIISKEESNRFRDLEQDKIFKEGLIPSPLVTKVFLELDEPSLANNTADHQRVIDAVRKNLDIDPIQTGLKILKNLSTTLRDNGYKVTVTVGQRKEIAEVMAIEGGNTADSNYLVVVDMGTTTVVAHLVDANSIETMDAMASFNSGGIYGREVTARMMAAEKKGIDELQNLIVGDINQLIRGLARENDVNLGDITAVVCAGNTAMGHFLLGLPTHNIRRDPYVPVSVAPSPLRAAEVGIDINSRGLLYSLPGISGWVGSDITAGILATEIHEKEELSLLVDIGTNGEIIVGNREWLIASSASAGPALEGASEECGMRAEIGAIEKVFLENGDIRYSTIGGGAPRGICGSGIIDLVSVLLEKGVIDRGGKIVDGTDPEKGFVLADEKETQSDKPIFITETDIENVITAKAAVFAAIKILMERISIEFTEIDNFYLAGAFGNYINVDSAINIGLIPEFDREKIKFVGNTSIKGAKIVAFYKEALNTIDKIRKNTTYYDLMGADDYVDEFRKALFLPHTDIELFKKKA